MVKWSTTQKGEPELMITDALGRVLVYEKQNCPEQNCMSVSIPNLAKGIYFYHFSIEKKSIAKGKLVME